MAISQNYPALKPSLSLDFANVKALDPRITFTRASSATYYNANGLLESEASGEARFDHNPVTKESLGLLIEEQRTNLLVRSEEFDNAGWSAFGTKTIISNTLIAPDGTLTADSLSSPGNNGIQQTVTCSASTQYTLSVFAKEGADTHIRFSFTTTGGTTTSGGPDDFAIASGTPVGNGWFRLSYLITTLAGNTQLIVRIQSRNPVTTPGIFIWGAQLEVGAFPTSYIPTVASQVTRAADAASMTGANFSSWYNAAEGSLYLDAFSQSARVIAGLGQGTFATNIGFNVVNLMRSAGSTPSLLVGTAVAGSVKLAGVIKPGDFAASANGSAVATSTANLTTPFTANILQIGSTAGVSTFNGTIKKLAYYPVRIQNSQLQALTS